MMFKYFQNCKDISSLKKEYIKLMKKYHPDLSSDEDEIEFRNNICAEINAEYDIAVRILPATKDPKDILINKEIIDGNESFKETYKNIVFDIEKPNIDYKYYYYIDGVNWSEEEMLKEVSAMVKLFWEVCRTKQIAGDEFTKLYELCQYNVEKMKRTIMFLSTGAIPDKDIHTNLQSNNAIPFLNDNIIVDNLPDYDSFLILSRENTKKETYAAWIEFCQKQRDDFLNRYYEYVVPKITDGKTK